MNPRNDNLLVDDVGLNYLVMENILRLVSYNCRGMPRQSNALCNRPSLQLLLDDTENDIICVLY